MTFVLFVVHLLHVVVAGKFFLFFLFFLSFFNFFSFFNFYFHFFLFSFLFLLFFIYRNGSSPGGSVRSKLDSVGSLSALLEKGILHTNASGLNDHSNVNHSTNISSGAFQFLRSVSRVRYRGRTSEPRYVSKLCAL